MAVNNGEALDVSEADPSVAPADSAEVAARSSTVSAEVEGDAAADYLERLLDIADLDGDIDMGAEGARTTVSIELPAPEESAGATSAPDGGDLQRLVGANGEVLEALQELTRLAVLRETGERSRLMLDIAGHRARRRAELAELGRRTAEDVRRSGEAARLAPMTAFERKVVHDAAAAAGLVSESEGDEPQRRVVIRPR